MAESLYVANNILSKPDAQKKIIIRACILASRQILKNRPVESELYQAPLGVVGEDVFKLASGWNESLNVSCPLEYDGSCLVYDQRPISCREYFVSGSNRGCKDRRAQTNVVEIPVSMSAILCKLGSELAGNEPEAILLPLVLAWYQDNEVRGQQKWPAARVFSRLAEIVKEVAAEKSELLAAIA